jgi:hypothetical protein
LICPERLIGSSIKRKLIMCRGFIYCVLTARQ